jgi:hypothetical protein
MNKLRFWLAVFLPAFAGFGLVLASVCYFHEYGGTLFMGLPFTTGIASAILAGRGENRAVPRIYGAGQLSLLVLGVCLLFLKIEGIVCLVMASPLASVIGLLGSLVGYGLLELFPGSRARQAIPLLLVCFMPFVLNFEASRHSAPVLHEVVSTVEIDAPIETVWKNVVAFPQIEKEPEGILKLGFAYPINAKIDGSGVGATRYCNFNTGPFVEPITLWQEPNLLAFDVKEQPQPMIETTPYGELHTAHMEYIRSQKGQFRLYEKDGKTVLEGTTYYTHDIAPDFYWRLFSDEIIHQIHMRVLTHIKEVSEK